MLARSESILRDLVNLLNRGDAANIPREKLVGKGLKSVESRRYMGAVVGLLPDRVRLNGDGGFITFACLGAYDVVEPSEVGS